MNGLKGIVFKVEATIREHKLFSDGDKVLVALSGGADSVALLRLLLDRKMRCEAVHCNFHLRGAESDRDEYFVRNLCRELKVRLHVRAFNTQEYAMQHGVSIEMAARDLRYAYFRQLKEQLRFDKIAVAHHRDDNVETLLLNLLRGTGLKGLGAMQYMQGDVVRPLLDVSREELETYLQVMQQPYVVDSTNLEEDVLRNKIRLSVIPLLKQLQPAVMDVVHQEIKFFKDAYTLYKRAVDTYIPEVFDGERINIEKLLTLPSPETILYEILAKYGFHTTQVHDIYQGLEGVSGRLFESDQWRLLRDRKYLQLRSKSATFECLCSHLPLQGEVVVTEDLSFIITRMPIDDTFEVPKRKDTACFDIDKLSYPLTVRKYETGERFMPYGMKKMKLVSDYLTDEKKSLFDKEKQLVVCSGSDVAWLVGERTDQRFCVDKNTRHVLMIVAVNGKHTCIPC